MLMVRNCSEPFTASLCKVRTGQDANRLGLAGFDVGVDCQGGERRAAHSSDGDNDGHRRPRRGVLILLGDADVDLPQPNEIGCGPAEFHGDRNAAQGDLGQRGGLRQWAGGRGFTGRELRRQNPLAGAKQLHDRARRRWLGARQAAIHRNYRAIFVERRHSPETGLGSNDLIPCIVAICEKRNEGRFRDRYDSDDLGVLP